MILGNPRTIDGFTTTRRFSPGGDVGGGGFPTPGGTPDWRPRFGGSGEGGFGGEIGGQAYGICGPGYGCSGPSIDLPGGISACLGACVPGPTNGGGRGTGILEPQEPVGGGVGSGVCDQPTRIFCQTTCGTNGSSANGCGCNGSCCLPNGRKGRKNKSGYYLKSGQYVAPGSKCVATRRMNYGNARALRRAISRARGFDRLVKSNRKALRKLATI